MTHTNVICHDARNIAELKRAEIIAATILELILYTEKETVRENISLDDIQGCVRNLLSIVEADPAGAISTILADETIGNYTVKHSINVCILSMITACNMSTKRREIIDIGTAALLHDVGKKYIGKSIIYKNGSLTEEERKTVNQHPVYGAALIKSIFNDISDNMAFGILYHHERMDGRGYPEGLCTGIPYCARIIAAADVFEAYMAKRPYHEKRTLAEGIAFLMSHEGLEKGIVQCLIGQLYRHELGWNCNISAC